MPSLLQPQFATLINALPVQEHVVNIDANFWLPRFSRANLCNLWATIFGNAPTISISRQRLLNFAYPTPEQKCAEILLWGYPNDQHGVVGQLLPQLATIAQVTGIQAPWDQYYLKFRIKVANINISTITKLAYFHRLQFNGLDALILDSRVIKNSANWVETSGLGLTYPNAQSLYIGYLTVMNQISNRLGCTADQLEFFLFSLGKAF